MAATMTATAPLAKATKAATDKTLRVFRAKRYPEEMWWFVACFIATVALFQFGSWVALKLGRKFGSKSNGDAESGAQPAPRRFSIRHIPRAIINTYRIIAFRWTLHIGSWYTLNLAEVFVTCAYIIGLFIWEFINTTDLEGVKFDYVYWGNRAGTIAASQLPLITVLGTKNNVVSYVTGISYDKLNYVHRMSARVVFVLLWVHGGNRFVGLNWSKYPFYFIPVGLTAMVAFSILCFISLQPVRARAYEFFFIVHFLSVLILLLGGYFHAREEKMGYYIWPSFLIWALDRFIRVMRVIVFNYRYFWFGGKRDSLDATVELLSPHFVRLRLARPPHFHWSPGQTAYIVMPGVSRLPTEAHPFTIASVETPAAELADASTDLEKEKAKTKSEFSCEPYWRELVFLVNVRGGFTKRLAERAHKGEKVKVLVDGPYGLTPNLKDDDEVILVAGGSGVTYTLSTFLGVVNDVRAGKSACRKLVWIWAIRDSSHIDWVSKALQQALELAPPFLDISVRIYVTSGEPLPVTNQRAFDDDSIHEGGSDAHSGEKSSAVISLLDFSAVQVSSGRPDLHALLRDEVAAVSGRLSVSVCGSQAISRACRSALNFPVGSPAASLKGGPNVILHVESFGYA